MASFRLLSAADYRRQRWANGLGWTREIVRVPDSDDWDWRLSIAESDSPAAFSELPGIDRELVLLHGAGLVLRFADGEVRQLTPGQHARLVGERALVGEPIAGPSQQLNLMWRRDRLAMTIRPYGCENGAPVTWPVGTRLIHLLEGGLECRDGEEAERLRPGDSILLEGRSACALISRGPVRLLVVVGDAPPGPGRPN